MKMKMGKKRERKSNQAKQRNEKQSKATKTKSSGRMQQISLPFKM